MELDNLQLSILLKDESSSTTEQLPIFEKYDIMLVSRVPFKSRMGSGKHIVYGNSIDMMI